MTTTALHLVEHGPCRCVGLRRVGKGNSDLPGLWDKLNARVKEIPVTGNAFGVCRCVPGATDGTFEYLALYQVSEDASIPPGMVELRLPRATYAVFDVASLADIGNAWGRASDAVNASGDLTPYCGKNGCQCATHPSFELYPESFCRDGKLMLYIPVKQT